MGFFNFCPKCASKNIDFENNRRLLCHDCGMVYFHNVAAAVAVIIERDDEILFTIRNKDPKAGMLDLPGGFTDPDETSENTCTRELKEELDLDIPAADFKYFKSHPNDYEYKGVPYKTEDLIFTASLPKDYSFKLEESEIRGVRWVKKSEINYEQIAFESLKTAIKDFLNRDSQ